MNQGNIRNNSDESLAIPVKRRRGRPRKDQSLNRVNVVRVTGHSLNHVDATHMPPGFETSNQNHPNQVEPNNDANDDMVGQPITGVVESSFGDGYLISVMIGNSNTSFRGVVFKPGHFVPVTADNDVAPNLQMIRRNEVHHPAASHTRVPSQSREKVDRHASYVSNGTSSSNHARRPIATAVANSKGKNASVIAAPSVSPVGARGTVVPVVLQPASVSNGLSPAHTSSRDVHVHTVTPLAVYPPSGSMLFNQVPEVAKNSQKVTQNGRDENVSYEGIPETVQGKSVKLNDVLMLEGVQGSSSVHSQIENSKATGTLSTEEAPIVPERDIGDMNKPPSMIETLQAAVSDYHNRSASVIKPSASRTGRMTELLQENMMENQVPRREKLATDADSSAFR